MQLRGARALLPILDAWVFPTQVFHPWLSGNGPIHFYFIPAYSQWHGSNESTGSFLERTVMTKPVQSI